MSAAPAGSITLEDPSSASTRTRTLVSSDREVIDTELIEIPELFTSSTYLPLPLRVSVPESVATIENPAGTGDRSGSAGVLEQATERTAADAARNMTRARFTILTL